MMRCVIWQTIHEETEMLNNYAKRFTTDDNRNFWTNKATVTYHLLPSGSTNQTANDD